MSIKNETTLVSLKMPKDFHKRLKMTAAITGQSINEIIL